MPQFPAYICPFSRKADQVKCKHHKGIPCEELQKRGLPTEGTVRELKQRLIDHLKRLEREYQDKGVDTKKLILTEEIQPCALTTASDSLLICSSGVHRCIYNLQLSSNGVAMNGEVTLICNYPENTVAV